MDVELPANGGAGSQDRGCEFRRRVEAGTIAQAEGCVPVHAFSSDAPRYLDASFLHTR